MASEDRYGPPPKQRAGKPTVHYKRSPIMQPPVCAGDTGPLSVTLKKGGVDTKRYCTEQGPISISNHYD